MIISLIGYRGCGKSTVAKCLAERLNWAWADADSILEREAGQTIREIFATEGEAGFRRRERATLVSLLRERQLILATGGGAILNPETRQELALAGPVVWLQATVEVLAARIQEDSLTASRRPQLTSGGMNEIREVLAFREPLYRSLATLTLDAASGSPEELAAQIHAVLQDRLANLFPG